jgi:hypothetical protein
MENIKKRLLLFLIGCIGTRLLLVYLAKTLNPNYVKYLGYISILIGLSFIYLFFSGSRKTGPEVFGDNIWWNYLRPVHGILYLLFAYYAINDNNKAWMFLLVDVIIGFISFIIYHYKADNFKKLF